MLCTIFPEKPNAKAIGFFTDLFEVRSVEVIVGHGTAGQQASFRPTVAFVDRDRRFEIGRAGRTAGSSALLKRSGSHKCPGVKRQVLLKEADRVAKVVDLGVITGGDG